MTEQVIKIVDRNPKQLTVGDLRVASELISRLGFAGQYGFQFGGDRDLYEALGYNTNITLEDYHERWKRGGIARRIVNAKPRATWRIPPEIYDHPDPKKITRWDKEWKNFTAKHNVWNALERLDTLAGLGHYAVLLVGMKGSSKLENPAPDNVRGADGILYMQPYSERNAKIVEIEQRMGNPRFGLPTLYEVDVSNDVIRTTPSKVRTSRTISRSTTRPVLVHWSRVVHFADEAFENDVYGAPRLECVWNDLDNLDKVVGGSGEMFWRGGYAGLHANINKEAALSPAEEEALDEQFKEYEHRLRRFIQTRQATVNTLQSQIGNPRGPFSVLAAVIAGATGIPQRILFGSERGELASSQDRANWNEITAERQRNIAEPKALRQLLDLLIRVKALSDPVRPLVVAWPDLTGLPENERADNLVKIANAEKAHAEAKKSGTTIMTDGEAREMIALPASMAPDTRDDEENTQDPEDKLNKPTPTPDDTNQ